MATRPANITLYVYQGQTFDDEIRFEDSNGDPLDFTDMTARMQVRRAAADDEVLAEFTTEDGSIAELDEMGIIGFNVSAADTTALPTDNVDQAWVYDLELIDGDHVTRLMQGGFVVSPEVTRT